ncbi:MAG: aminodeoxychorismate synthase component I [Clostridiaceae bacterium]
MNFKIEEIKSNLTSYETFSILYNDENYKDNLIFLDSQRDFENMGRFSIIGVCPYLTIKYKNNIVYLNNEKYQCKDIFKVIKEELSKYKIENKTELPFIAGALGYLSYELGRDIEVIPEISEEDVNIPWCYFNFYENIIVYDNILNKKYITAMGINYHPDYSINRLRSILIDEKPNSLDESHEDYKTCGYTSNFFKEEYIKTVDKVKNYIKEGDIYIANLTQRLVIETSKNPLSIYTKLREINPAPFSSFLKLDGFDVISSSPERFLKIQNKIVETRPIKGTRPRGATVEEDNKNRDELINSEKDKSELLMIVDLERNDLSKVCKENTVKVKELFKCEEYSTVFHLVSTITGELKDEFTGIDCVKACFPGGSITGAPKIRAMEIIDELEKVRREIYTGAIGYLGFDGNIDLNIVIRTILKKDNKCYIGVGGGITYESDSEFEYEETLAKAKALLMALE